MQLKPLYNSIHRKGSVLVIVLDGIGIGSKDEGNAFYRANTPVFDQLCRDHLHSEIHAHGTFVGLPSDGDMGNSEVGHNVLGAGQIFPQGSKLVNLSMKSGEIFNGEVWQKLIGNALKKKTPLHFLGLLSDGNVHSHINHLKKMVEKANEEGVVSIRLHALLDGRDVGPKTAHLYIKDIETFFENFNDKGRDYAIASVGGRQVVTMDRYGANWEMVEKGWALHVEGLGRQFPSALAGLKTLREESDKIDQDLEPFVIAKDEKPIGRIEDDHSVIFFNFRGDRGIEISRAFDEQGLDKIKRKNFPKVQYAAMMEYDGDLHIPKKYLVKPPKITQTMGEYLVNSHLPLFALSETQKYGHVTYFWNGNKSGKFSEELEEYVEIPSDKVSFEQKPWMKSAEIADETIRLIKSGRFKTGRINFAGGDMVGHTGDFDAAVIAVEVIDYALGRILKAINETEGIAIILADHGNCEEMLQKGKNGQILKDDQDRPTAKTSHTLNKVPFIIYDPKYNGEYFLNIDDNSGLGNVAATVFNLMGFEAPVHYLPALIEFTPRPSRENPNLFF